MIILCLYRQRQDSLVDFLEVDLHCDRLLLFLAFVLVRVLSALRAFAGGCRARFALLFLTGLLLIALRSERRGQVFGQDRDVDAARHRTVHHGHIATGGREAHIGAGGEVEVLAVGIELRESRVAHAVGHLPAFPILQGIDEHGVQVVVKLLGVSEPSAVRGPGRLQSLARQVRVQVHMHWRGVVQVHVPEVQALVRVSDLLAVRRPCGRIEERWRFTKVNLSHLADATLVAEVQGVFA